MSAHTPGPWRVARATDYSDSAINVDAGTRAYVAQCGVRGDVEAEANARLIAALPDMHGALIEAVQAARDAFEAALQEVPEGSCVPPWITRLEQAAERAHAALVKADDRFKARSAS